MDAPQKVKVGMVQMSCVPDRQENIRKVTGLIRQVAREGARIICLQELFATPYFCWEENYEYFRLSESVPGPSTDHFSALAREVDAVLVLSLFEKRTEGLYHNTAAVIDADGTYLGKYRKHHIPDDPGYYEKFYFTPGDGGYRAFDTRYGKIGVLICWDQWYPEAARITCLSGAQILFYPTAIGWDVAQDETLNRSQYEAWQTIQRGHSVANGVYVVAVNRTGTEGRMKFWGGSFVSDPFGRVLYRAPHEAGETQVVELDMGLVDETRIHWPFLRDRRIDSYGPIVNRFLDE